ncbi:MAG TPA: ABC transporter permease [Tissierellia bacterium]|nr:ABC transporter permease [Tissierellia bacterium]
MKTYKSAAGPYLLWAVMFIIISLVMVLYYSLTNEAGQLTLANFERFFTGSTLGTLWRSLKVALLTTIICLLIGYPMAYIISTMRASFRTTAIMLVVIPMWMNFLLRTYGWVTILSKNGILNSLLRPFGVAPLDLLYTEGAVTLGMVYNFLPFMILPIYTVLEKMDHGLIEAAADLGANKMNTFLKVIFPLSLPGIASGVSMVFIPAISTFEITALLGGNKTNLIGNVIEQQFTVTGDWNYGSAMSMVLMVFLVVSLLFSRGDEDEAMPNQVLAEERSREVGDV